MDDKLSSGLVLDGSISRIEFSLATSEEIRTYSINGCPISHPSQLANPFLGLPLESGKCESCGTDEIGNCEGHFGHIELPIPVYLPSHISELGGILSCICLKCLRMKKVTIKHGAAKDKVSNTSCIYCRDLPPISIREVQTSDFAISLELAVPQKTRVGEAFWNFLDRYGFHYGGTSCRPLLPHEALNILKQIPEETTKRLVRKGYFPQRGLIMEHLPVPPNCLCVPEISDGKCVMSSDISRPLLKKVLNKIDLIKRSRSGPPNFESHVIEANELQSCIAQYIHLRGTTKSPHDSKRRFALSHEPNELSTKQWLEKIRTLFIRKGSGFSSRCVITGDPYIGVDVLGLPYEIAKRITFEERVTEHNISRLQNIVDKRQCITYKDGSYTYAISLGSKGHTSLKVGQIINRQIVDGDIVFINRPPSTHKHSLQAFRAYIHDDHTVKINPLICAALGADFDGDCVHIFYPQSLAAKAEVLELFSVDKQLLCSHSGKLNMQLVHDSLLALKLISNSIFLKKTVAQQLAMHEVPALPLPTIIKGNKNGPSWTTLQILQNVLPAFLDISGEHYSISQSEILKLDSSKDIVQLLLTDIPSAIHQMKGPKDVLKFFNYIQPLLMEMLFIEGFSISLKDFDVPKSVLEDIQRNIQEISCIMNQLRSSYNELVQLQVQNYLKNLKAPILDFVRKFSAIGNLIDMKSDSAMAKVVEQIGFLSLQLFDQGKYYSRVLVEDCFVNYVNKHSTRMPDQPSESYGLVRNSFFHGLAPFEELVHSISSREVIVRSSRGLTEPGTLFKNLMAILRDVVICYDGTVRNDCTGSIVQFEYLDDAVDSANVAPAGEPVGVLAATAISTPAYKAVLESSQSNNSSWELMKEILLCKVGHRNDVSDRRVILYLNDCYCKKRFCKEKAAYTVLNCLKKVSLKECACDFSIEYKNQINLHNTSVVTSGLVGHIHLDKIQLKLLNQNTDAILRKCQDVIFSYGKKKGQLSHFFKRLALSANECFCTKQQSDEDLHHSHYCPCLQFSYSDASAAQNDESLQRAIHIMAKVICPILLDTIVKGDPRILEAKIVWIESDTTSSLGNTQKSLKGEVGVEVVVEKNAVQQIGDAWRIVMDASLPVMHLIDTNRSVPKGIRQIQELLGISTAFDQAVQRLSRSIRMVAKGVMKDHLLLVANSMTCTGSLIGFNTGGYKALFRSFKVQVPFTAATLFTPMKCFERAAEKRHFDSLTSVVSSCSWGKTVAIGTGAPFQIIWDQKQMSASQHMGKGVYEFLQLLKPIPSGEATGTCLVDVDELAEDNEIDDSCLSPEFNGYLTFDESHEVGCNFQKNGRLETDDWQGWESREPTVTENSKLAETSTTVWSSWDSSQDKKKIFAPANFVDETGKSAEKSFWNLDLDSGDKSADWQGWESSEPTDMKNGKLEEHKKDCPESPNANAWQSVVTPNAEHLDNQPWNCSATKNLDRQWSQNTSSLSNTVDGGKQSWNTPGWGSGRRNYSGRTAGTSEARKDWNSKRRETFTVEEEKILAEIDPIIHTVRRIIRDSSNGDKLSDDNQKFILESVFEYHPNKHAKVSVEVDYIKVDKHESFQDSRCFFVVSTDGSSVDFSYIKCLENYIKTTFSEHGVSFCRKYFGRRRSGIADECIQQRQNPNSLD